MARPASLTGKTTVQTAFPVAIAAILVGDHALFDRLLDDFKWIAGLALINPFNHGA